MAQFVSSDSYIEIGIFWFDISICGFYLMLKTTTNTVADACDLLHYMRFAETRK